MENPATWNHATRIIYEALAEARRQSEEHIFGLSEARIIHDALDRAGLLVSDPEEFNYPKHSIDTEQRATIKPGPFAKFKKPKREE